MKPASVRVAVAAAVIGGLSALVGVVIVLVHAGHNADVFVRNHPDQSRTLGLVGSFILAGLVAVLAGLQFLGAWKLHAGRRSGWLLLLILACLGMLGTIGTRSVVGLLSSIPDVVLLVCLLAPATRSFVQEERTSTAPA